MDFILPLLWSLRGQQPAQETRCFDDGNTDMSGPISERMAIAVIGFLSNPGRVWSKSRTAEKGSAIRKISCSIALLWASSSSMCERHWRSLTACSWEIAPSTAACISSIGVLQRLSTNGATSKVSPGWLSM